MSGDGRLSGKVAIITGAARGMGAATSARFVAEGARVVVTDIDKDAGLAFAESLGAAAEFVQLDVGDETEWSSVVEAAEEKHGSIDILINNAGFSQVGSVEDFALKDFDGMVRVNQLGVLLGMRAVLAPMRRAGRGSIVNVASAAALHGLAGLVVYSGTKFAVRGMSQAAATELAPDNIRVNMIHPGATDTAMHQQNSAEWKAALLANIPLNRFGQPEDIAEMALFLASDSSSYITGSDFVVDGGFLL